ncbi:MAG: 30S ribosomal protein S8e [Desulfurococcaceae archaeon]|nr:30S ribosomal protein S8e [Desulfurococcaceae archaeon]MCC6053041.1 30S ribosomal protein S8e [Desulfurococcaceae archaeon]
MSYYQGKDLQKPSGGVRGRHRKVKRKYELGSPPTLTRISNEEVRKIERVYGGGVKVRLKEAMYVNVALPDGVIKRVKVVEVVETPENPQYAKSGIVSRGSLVKTELGLVKITSRPGQDGVLNGVLVTK